MGPKSHGIPSLLVNWEASGSSGKASYIPVSLPKYRKRISNIELHCFGDASGRGTSAAVYAVVSRPSGDSVGLLAVKSRSAKQGLPSLAWSRLLWVRRVQGS